MLQYLRIRNLALLESAEIDFAAGFSAVTGETGAGKSVLLGALALLSGARAEKTLIAEGTEELEVEAGLYFSESRAVDRVLQELELPPCEEGALLLRRTLARSRMPKIQVNGRATTVANLRVLGEQWIDFHGPGEPQKLFHESTQRTMLDLFADCAAIAAEYHEHYRAWQKTRAEADELAEGTQLNEDELAFLRAQIEQIDAAGVTPEAIDALEADYRRASNAQELAELEQRISETLAGEDGIISRLGALQVEARRLAEMEPGAAPLAERVESAGIELDDLAGDFAALARELDLDEANLADTEERMNRWLEVRRKFGGSVEAVLARRAEMARKIEVQGDVEGTIHQLRVQADKEKKQLDHLAEEWTKKRRRAAEQLSTAVASLLTALGFKNAGLSIKILPEDDLKPHGNSTCRILFSPNPGRSPLPLDQIASSGETARVMLALKAVMARVDATPVLVFDEVDANVGGEIGGNVGSELARLGAEHQVLCVTHLPQVAAQAGGHFKVEKTQGEAATRVNIFPIHDNPDARVDELARMLGDRRAKSAREHASALLGMKAQEA